MDAPHLSPRLIIEKPILPALAIWVRSDGQEARLQRWYDITPDVLNGVGIRSLDFVPDGVVRLVDKNDHEIHRLLCKLTDELDGLSLLLARIEKLWFFSHSASEFWSKSCDLLLRSQVPSFKEIAPQTFTVCRSGWLELACFWIAFLACTRHQAGQLDWNGFRFGDQLIFKYVDFYNESPSRGPKLREPIFQVDRVHLQSLLEAVRKAASNHEKKEALEILAERLLNGVAGFEVLSNKNTATGEIDRVIRSTVAHPIVSRFGSHILVECKQWKKTVGTDPLGAFIADIRDARLNSGFFFSSKPVSKSAKKRIDNFYQRDGGFVIVLTEADLQSVCDGANFAHMLIEKLEAIMFQRQ